jgi:RNA recognition motif-containing protein
MGGKNGSVVLFLRNLPYNVTRRDLKLFIQTELRKAGIRGNPLLNLCSNCSILKITDPAAATHEYHGLVEIQPARIALLAIGALNGKQLAGSAIEVRRYRHRSPWGERRNRTDERRDSGVEPPPLRERRRPNLKIELVETTPALHAYGALPALV